MVCEGGQPTRPRNGLGRATCGAEGMINTHHTFQTLTRSDCGGVDRECFRAAGALTGMARLTPETLELGVTVAMSNCMLSG